MLPCAVRLWPRGRTATAPFPDHVSACSRAPPAYSVRLTLPANDETNTDVPSRRPPQSSHAAAQGRLVRASPTPTGDVCGSLGGLGARQLCPGGLDLGSILWAGTAACPPEWGLGPRRSPRRRTLDSGRIYP